MKTPDKATHKAANLLGIPHQLISGISTNKKEKIKHVPLCTGPPHHGTEGEAAGCLFPPSSGHPLSLPSHPHCILHSHQIMPRWVYILIVVMFVDISDLVSETNCSPKGWLVNGLCTKLNFSIDLINPRTRNSITPSWYCTMFLCIILCDLWQLYCSWLSFFICRLWLPPCVHLGKEY